MNKKTIKSIKFIATILVFGVLGFLIAKFIGETFKDSVSPNSIKPGSEFSKPLIISGIIVMMYLVLVIHELGHLITGLVQGFRFELFVVGFLGIKREEDNSTKIYFNTDLNFFGGVAATTPKNIDPSNVQKFANILLAGPIASILFAIICASLIFITKQPWTFFFMVGAMGSAMIFLATTLPSSTGTFYTDRKRYQRLVKEGKERDIELAMMEIQGWTNMGKPISQIELSKLQIIQEDESPMFKYIGYFYELAYSHTKAIDQVPLIKEKMRTLEEELPKGMAPLFEKELEKLLAKET